MNYEAVVLVIQKIIFIGLALLIFVYRKDSTVALFSFLISMLISWQIIQVIFIRKRKLFKDGRQHEEIQFKAYFKDVMSLALVEVFSIVYFRVTQIILERFGGYEQVGVYSASYKLVEAFTNIPSILMIVLFPGFAKLAVDNIPEFRIQFRKILLLLIAMGTAACIITWFGGQTFFSFIGKDYDRSYLIVRYMAIALFAIYPNYLLTQSLIALDQNLKYAAVVFTALVMNIIIAILAVPKYGAAGSAISVGICEVIIFILCYMLINRTIKQVGTTKT
jgi:O-antigen/teichoic acid export membrane protein